MAGTKGDIKVLEQAQVRLAALVDTSDDSKCSVPVEHKEGVKLYINTWVEPLVTAALEHLRDGTPIPNYLLER